MKAPIQWSLHAIIIDSNMHMTTLQTPASTSRHGESNTHWKTTGVCIQGIQSLGNILKIGLSASYILKIIDSFYVMISIVLLCYD